MNGNLTDAQRRQYQALTTAAAWCEWTGVAHVRLGGRDRISFLHNLCTGDIKRLQPGQGCEAFLTNVQGKIVAFALVYCEAEAIWLDMPGGDAARIVQHLDRCLIREDVQLEEGGPRRADLLLAGPESMAVLGDLGVAELDDQRLAHRRLQFAGQELAVRRSDWIAPLGFQITGDAESLAALGEALTAAGVSRCDEVAELARLERGSPANGREITDARLPQEVDRDERAISFTKGCYLGQETVARIDALGHVNWKLRGLRGGPHPCEPGQELKQGDVVVARVTSSGWSPRLDQPLALAYVRRGHELPGTTLAETPDPPTVVGLPLDQGSPPNSPSPPSFPN